jgi:hypothetical protein
MITQFVFSLGLVEANELEVLDVSSSDSYDGYEDEDIPRLAMFNEDDDVPESFDQEIFDDEDSFDDSDSYDSYDSEDFEMESFSDSFEEDDEDLERELSESSSDSFEEDDMPVAAALNRNGKIFLQFDRHNRPLFKASVLRHLKEHIMELKRNIFHGRCRHAKYSLRELFGHKTQLRKLLFLLKHDPHILGGRVLKHDLRKLIKLVDEAIFLFKKFCKHRPPHTPRPTPHPTRKPTRHPTPHPTPEPTEHPTRHPTPRPTHKPRGQCTHEIHRFDTFHEKKKIAKTVKFCGKLCHGHESCSTKCVKKHTKLSKSCSKCFGKLNSCARHKCGLTCMFMGDHACDKCTKKKCVWDLNECAFGHARHEHGFSRRMDEVDDAEIPKRIPFEDDSVLGNLVEAFAPVADEVSG